MEQGFKASITSLMLREQSSWVLTVSWNPQA